jgi:phosphate transport system permease protein
MGQTGFLTFKDVSVTEYFFSVEWVPENNLFGAGVFFIGTIVLTLLTMIISVPFSIAIAVFLAEIAPTKLKEIFRPILDLLVGIPSVIYGFLGLTILVPFLQGLTGSLMGDGLLAAALVLSLMVLPTIARISDDSIEAVPQKYREAAYALGCTKLQTIFYVVLPAARRGIISAIILGMTRALGETMAVVMVIGNVPQLAESLFQPTSVLTTNIVMQITNVAFGTTWSNALYMMGFMLLVIALVLIIVVRILNSRGEVQ